MYRLVKALTVRMLEHHQVEYSKRFMANDKRLCGKDLKRLKICLNIIDHNS